MRDFTLHLLIFAIFFGLSLSADSQLVISPLDLGELKVSPTPLRKDWTIKNNHSAPIKITVARITCPCIKITNKLPITLQAGQQTVLKLKVWTNELSENFSHHLFLRYTLNQETKTIKRVISGSTPSLLQLSCGHHLVLKADDKSPQIIKIKAANTYQLTKTTITPKEHPFKIKALSGQLVIEWDQLPEQTQTFHLHLTFLINKKNIKKSIVIVTGKNPESIDLDLD